MPTVVLIWPSPLDTLAAVSIKRSPYPAAPVDDDARKPNGAEDDWRAVSKQSDAIDDLVGRVTHVEFETAFVFVDQQSKKSTEKRSWSRLSNDAKMDAVFSALGGMRAVGVLLEAETKSVEAWSTHLVAESLNLAAVYMTNFADALKSACANTSAKKYANLAHRKLNRESRQRQKAEQLLVKGGSSAGYLLPYVYQEESPQEFCQCRMDQQRIFAGS